MKTSLQLEIPKRSLSCCHKGEKFLPGTDYFSLIQEDEKQKIKRQDFCAACWQELILAHSETPSFRGYYWKSKIEKKNAATPSSRTERALKLFKSLIIEASPPEEELFVLVLLLAHLRRLVCRKEIEEEGVRYGLYEILNQDEFVKIKHVDLSTLEIEKIQQALAAKLTR